MLFLSDEFVGPITYWSNSITFFLKLYYLYLTVLEEASALVQELCYYFNLEKIIFS